MVPPPQKINLKDKVEDGEIDLSMSDLQEVPVKEISTIKNVHSLDLSNNHISLLPGNFSTLVHLTKLDLSKNELTQLPDNFGNLIKLKHLDLYKNQLKHLPLSFGNLNALKWLDLKDNPLVPAIATVAGPCLESKQCHECAKNVVAFYSKLEALLQEAEEQKPKLDDQKNANSQKLKQEKKKKDKKNKSKQTKETEQLADDILSNVTKIENILQDVDQENNQNVIKTRPLSMSTCFKFLLASIFIFIIMMFVLTAAKVECIKNVEDKIVNVWNTTINRLPVNVQTFMVVIGNNIKSAYQYTTNGILLIIDYFDIYCGNGVNVILTELSQVFRNASQAANKLYINVFGNK